MASSSNSRDRAELVFDERQITTVTHVSRWIIRGLLILYLLVGMWAFHRVAIEMSYFPGRFFDKVAEVTKAGPFDPHDPEIYNVVWEPLGTAARLILGVVSFSSIIVALVAMNVLNYRL